MAHYLFISGAHIACPVFYFGNTIIEYCRQIQYRSVESSVCHFDSSCSYDGVVAFEDWDDPIFIRIVSNNHLTCLQFLFSVFANLLWTTLTLVPLWKIFTSPHFPDHAGICLSRFERLSEIMVTNAGWHKGELLFSCPSRK